MKIRRHPFTLLEIMVSIALLALLSSTIVWKGWSLLSHYRFIHSADRLQNELLLTHHLAQSYQVDITITLTPKKGKLLFARHLDGPPRLLKNWINKPLTLSAITFDTPAESLTSETPLTILFYPTGEIIVQSAGHTIDRATITLHALSGNAGSASERPL